MEILQMKKINVICPTFRSDKNAIIRKIGVYSLIESLIDKKNVRLCVVDSSVEPLEIFRRNENVYKNIIYLHVPNKRQAFLKYEKLFPQAMKFCITSNHSQFKQILKRIKAWDCFIPWDEGYPVSLSLKKQFLAKRPSIGMKRNMAIAALEETFGAADVICYADDDDFRSDDYFTTMGKLIKDNDYIRISKWLTCNFNVDYSHLDCGVHDLYLHQDANGYWTPGILANKQLYNSQYEKSYDLLVKNRYSKLKNIAFSPVSYEGAMHVYSMNLWKKTVDKFGGILPVSMAEDVLFFTQCKNFFGEEFRVKLIKNKKFNFLRCAHNNTSVIEWTETINLNQLPQWAIEKIAFICNLLESQKEFEAFEEKLKKIVA